MLRNPIDEASLLSLDDQKLTGYRVTRCVVAFSKLMSSATLRILYARRGRAIPAKLMRSLQKG